MNSTASAQVNRPATLRALQSFGRIMFECDGKQAECTIDTAIHELRKTGRTLADVQLVDFDQAYRAEHPRSRQCQQVVDALLAAGLTDPALDAAKGR